MKASVADRAGVHSRATCYAKGDGLRVCRNASSRVEYGCKPVCFDKHCVAVLISVGRLQIKDPASCRIGAG